MADPNFTNEFAGEPSSNNSEYRRWNITYWRHIREWKEYPLTLTFFCIIMATLSVVGTLGNLFVLASFLFLDALRKIQYVFIAHLTLIDLAITSLLMPMNVVNTVYGQTFWKDKDWACEFIGTLCGSLCAASVWSIMAIALERYICICQYALHARLFTPSRMIGWIILIWIVAHSTHLPNFLGWGHTGYAKDFYLCTGDLAVASYSAYWAIFAVLLPTNVTFYAYLKIYLRIRVSQMGRNLIAGRSKSLPPCPEGQVAVPQTTNGVNVRTEIRLVKALFRVFMIFLISWLPVGVLFTMSSAVTAPKWINLAALILAHGNSATNSVVYFWLNSHLRESYLGFRRLRKARNHTVRPSREISVRFTSATQKSRLLQTLRVGSLSVNSERLSKG